MPNNREEPPDSIQWLPDDRTPGRPRDVEIDQRIVESASRLLDSEGIGAVTVTRVAKEAGVGRPTVYRRYPDSAAIARAVLEADLVPLLQRLATVEVDGPIAERVMALFVPVAEYYHHNPKRSRGLLEFSMLAEGGVGPKHNQATLAWSWRVASEITEAQQKGELDARLDPEIAVHSLFSSHLILVISGLNGLYPQLETRMSIMRRCVLQQLRVEA